MNKLIALLPLIIIAGCTQEPDCLGMTYQEALEVYRNSECFTAGELNGFNQCNDNTNNWWLGLNITGNDDCQPSCVINIEFSNATINYRCRGLLPVGTIGLANPASVYCNNLSGVTVFRDNENGTYGVCIFPDKSECEEWALYKKECYPSENFP